MKLRKGFFISLLAVALVLCVFALPKTAHAAYVSDLTFTLNETADGYIVSKCTLSATGDLVIPSTFNKLPVIAIGSNAFKNCSKLTNVTIPGSVTSIDSYAFHNCAKLVSVTILDGVTNIGSHVFDACVSLSSIIIPNSVTSIGDYAFFCCYNLTDITLPNSIISIGKGVFHSCNSLTDITLPDSVTSIGDYAFHSCKNLTGITLPNSITSIGGDAFSYCTSLTGITIPDSVTSIGENAFSSCQSLTSITIPDSVASIGLHAFAHCTSLTNLQVDAGNPVYHSAGNCIVETNSKTLVAGCKTSQIPSDGSINSIGDYAFYGCDNLTSITLPNGITSIGKNAFSSCEGLTSITIPDSVTSIGYNAFYYCTNLKTIAIPNGVTSIAEGTFFDCYNLASVTLPESVASIGRDAFGNCFNLSSITLPNSITNIGQDAFSWCTSLTGIIIPNGVSILDARVFSGCSNLSSITLPNSITNIGYATFYNCTKLSSVIYCGTQEQWNTISKSDNNEPLNNATLQYHSYENNACTFCGLCDIGVLEFELNYYGDGYVVSDCDAAASGELIIPDTYNGLPVTEIGEYALAGCSGLTKVVIPDSVTVIGYSAFSSSNYIEEIVLGNNVTTIDMYAFQGCGITELTIPASVTRIGDQAFWQCNKLLAFWVDSQNPVFSNDENGVLYNKNKTKLVKVPVGFSGVYVVPETVTNLGDGLNHTNITSVVLPKSITSIPENAFYNCYFLESIVIPYGVTTIGRMAFSDCQKLTTIAMPNTVQSIGYHAFWDCSSLETLIYCGAAEECQSLLQNENSMTGNMDLLYAKRIYHNYENCVCTICQATLHDWAEPTCTTPKTCTVCGAIEGEAVGHNYENGVCTACGAQITTVTVSTSKDTYHRGDTVTVTVGTSPILNCTSGGFLFNYDTNIFEYVSGEALVGGFGAAGISAEAGKLAGYFMNGQETVQGEIFQIVLRVKEDAVFSETDTSQTTITQKLTGTVSTDGSHLNVRSGASSAYPIVHYLADGARVEILETKTVNGIEWGRINEGWISMKFVKLDIVYGPGNTTISGEASFISLDGTVHCSVSGTKVTIACKHSYSEWTNTSTVQRKRTCEICGDEDIEYAVRFQYADGTLIATAWYHNGDIVTVPQDPSIQEAGLAFAGWDKEITVCIGDAIYTAVFERVYFPGDINGDDTVTYNDAVYLLLHTLFGEDVYPLHKAPADIDGNGTVDQDDAVYLLLHTLFSEEFYPLSTPVIPVNKEN